MPRKRNSEAPLPEETPVVSPQPEVKPPAEPVTPSVPAEAPQVRPDERPGEISPYDFPPPGDGLFPEIFQPA